MKSFFVPDHFQSHMLMSLMVIHFQNLSKRPFSYHLQDLVAVCYMVVGYMCVWTLKLNTLSYKWAHGWKEVEKEVADILPCDLLSTLPTSNYNFKISLHNIMFIGSNTPVLAHVCIQVISRRHFGIQKIQLGSLLLQRHGAIPDHMLEMFYN